MERYKPDQASRVLVLGAGLAGLTLAAELLGAARAASRPVQVSLVEKAAEAGGLCRTDRIDGFMFDRTGHLLHFRDAATRAWVAQRVSDLRPHARKAFVLLGDRLIPYPFQLHLGCAEPSVAEDCIVGLCERRPPQDPESFLEASLAAYGSGIVKAFLQPYNEKLQCIPAADLSVDWMGRFFPKPSVREIVAGAMRGDCSAAGGYNAQFEYPDSGIGALTASLANEVALAADILLRREVVDLDLRRRRAVLSDGTVTDFDLVVSTIPLKELPGIVTRAPRSILEAADALRCASVLNMNLGLKRPAPEGVHWVYLPEGKFAHYRVGFNSNFCRPAAPDGQCAVYGELAHLGAAPINGQEVLDDLLAVLRTVGMTAVSSRDIAVARLFDLEHAYVVFDRKRAAAAERIVGWLRKRGVYCLGRYGRWQYTSMEDTIREARALAAQVVASWG